MRSKASMLASISVTACSCTMQRASETSVQVATFPTRKSLTCSFLLLKAWLLTVMFVPCKKAQECGILGREAFGSSNSVYVNIDGKAVDSIHARCVRVCMYVCMQTAGHNRGSLH